MKMIEILRQHEDEIRELRMNGMKMKDLAKKYNVSYSTMIHFLTTHQIVLNKKPIKSEIKNEIVSKYLQGERYDYIAREYHMDKEAVKMIIINSGHSIREKSDAFQHYSINQHYFDEIDTPEKAYILGLLYTDGNRNNYNNHYQITLKLQDTDVDILYQIQDCLQSNRPLRYIITEPKMFPNGKVYVPKNQYALMIDNKQIATSLEKWGIISNKTYTLKFPDFLPEKLYPHFIRGCWEGDGWISKSSKDKDCGFMGTYDLVNYIREYTENLLDIHFSMFHKKEYKMENLYTISLHGGKQVKQFLDYLYQDSTIHFHRKYACYRHIVYNEPLINSLSIIAS